MFERETRLKVAEAGSFAGLAEEFGEGENGGCISGTLAGDAAAVLRVGGRVGRRALRAAQHFLDLIEPGVQDGQPAER